MGITYQQAGVDPDKAAKILSRFGEFMKTRPRDPNVLSGIGPFAACYSLKDIVNRYDDPVLVTSCDGVGTKAKLALEWGSLEGLGQDLVAMNVNDLLCAGAHPLFFLDYYACGKLSETQLMTLLKSIQAGCEISTCSLVGGETAEMPGVYQGEDFDLAGFTVGVAERRELLGGHRVKPGDRLLALPSSGVHSNGYSLVRKICEQENIKPDMISPFNNQTWRQALLAPTTIYVPLLKGILPQIHAAAHITGGGLFENLPRVLPEGVVAKVSSAAWRISEIFLWLQDKAGISTQELLSTFNCGVGMILICDQSTASQVVNHLERQGMTCRDIGSVESTTAGAPPAVTWE